MKMILLTIGNPGLFIVLGVFVVLPIVVFGYIYLVTNGFFDKFKRKKK